jgi:hypothetical protein
MYIHLWCNARTYDGGDRSTLKEYGKNKVQNDLKTNLRYRILSSISVISSRRARVVIGMRQTKASTGRSKFDQGKNLAGKQQNLLDLSSVKFQGKKTKQNRIKIWRCLFYLYVYISNWLTRSRSRGGSSHTCASVWWLDSNTSSATPAYLPKFDDNLVIKALHRKYK